MSEYQTVCWKHILTSFNITKPILGNSLDLYSVPKKVAAPVTPGILRYHSQWEAVNSTHEMQGIPLNTTILAPYSPNTEKEFWAFT